MTKENKDLLLKDLCSRLPYTIKGNFLNDDGSLSNDPLLRKVPITYSSLVTADGNDGMVLNGDVKPYLFPLSSMTEEQMNHYLDLQDSTTSEWGYPLYFDCVESIDWLNENHFDYRGLIENGLAIDATGLNIY